MATLPTDSTSIIDPIMYPTNGTPLIDRDDLLSSLEKMHTNFLALWDWVSVHPVGDEPVLSAAVPGSFFWISEINAEDADNAALLTGLGLIPANNAPWAEGEYVLINSTFRFIWQTDWEAYVDIYPPEEPAAPITPPPVEPPLEPPV